MQQPLLLRSNIEVTGLFEVAQAGAECEAFTGVLTQQLVLFRHQEEPAKDQRHHAQHNQRREYTPSPRQVETPHRELTTRDTSADDAAHQIAGNDEEHVNPSKTAAYTCYPEVIQHHRHHGPSTQPIDILPELLRYCALHSTHQPNSTV